MYHPLDEREFRLLILLPASQEEDIVECWLLYSHLELESLRYEALSYVWGDPLHTLPIELNGNTFQATANLEKALRTLRRMDGHMRLLWIDAICINQDDLDERSGQVALMGEIYAKAGQVLVWLGPKSTDTENAWRMILYVLIVDLLRDGEDGLRRISRFPGFEHFNGTPPTYSQALEEVEKFQAKYLQDPKALDDLKSWFQRPWFSRSWVVQEVTLGRTDKVTIFYGDDDKNMNFTMLPYAHQYWGLDSEVTISLPDDLPSTILGTSHFTNAWYMAPVPERPGFHEGSLSMLWIPTLIEIGPGVGWRDQLKTAVFVLGIMSRTNCTDPRDKVYAALHIIKKFGICPDIVPDYRQSVESVYMALAVQMIVKMQCVDLISMRAEPTLDRQNGLPTWCPDWREDCTGVACLAHYRWQGWGKRIAHFAAGDPHNPRGHVNTPKPDADNPHIIIEGNVLFVRGIHLSFLEEAVPSASFDQLRSYTEQLLLQHCQSPPVLAFIKDTQQSSRADFFHRLNGILSKENDIEEDHQLSEIWRLCDYIVQLRPTWGRRPPGNECVFRTSNGIFFFGPRDAKKGDEVVVLESSSTPHVLRKAGGSYGVVGSCHVHDYMMGEAWREKPERVRKIFRIE